MNSKQLSELLASKRVEAGVSLDVMAARLGTNTSTIKSLEDGVHSLRLKLVMDYISCLNLKLVVSTVTIDESEFKVFSFSSYQELVDWVISRWPWMFKRRSRIDASGIEYVKILDSHGKEIEFDKYYFLELMEKSQYELDVLNDEQIEEKQAAFIEQYDKLRKRNSREATALLISVFVGIIAFVYLDILIVDSFSEKLFLNIGFFGSLISANAVAGLVFPYILVGIILLFIGYVLYRILKWLTNGTIRYSRCHYDSK